MNIDFYGNLTYRDAQGVRLFMLAHRFAHDAEAQALETRFGGSFGTFGIGDAGAAEAWIDVMDSGERGYLPRALADWLEAHNNVHQHTLAAIGTTGIPVAVDLSVVDFADPTQFDEWIFIHQTLHQYEQQALGLT